MTEVLCHLRDFESVFLERARLTANSDLPDLPFPDPDQLALDHHYAQEEPWRAFEDWQRRRRALLEFFECLDLDLWERAGNHPTRGRFTLNHSWLSWRGMISTIWSRLRGFWRIGSRGVQDARCRKQEAELKADR